MNQKEKIKSGNINENIADLEVLLKGYDGYGELLICLDYEHDDEYRTIMYLRNDLKDFYISFNPISHKSINEVMSDYNKIMELYRSFVKKSKSEVLISGCNEDYTVRYSNLPSNSFCNISLEARMPRELSKVVKK